MEIVSTDGHFVGLHFQDSGMNTMFDKFPELLLIDATYKLTELRTPLYVLLVVELMAVEILKLPQYTLQYKKMHRLFKNWQMHLNSTTYPGNQPKSL